MNYHKRIKLEKARSKTIGQWSTTNKPNNYGNPGKKIVGNALTFGKMPGNGKFKVSSQSELYKVTTCYCQKCTDYLASLGVNVKTIPEEYGNILIELENNERPLVYDFKPRGSTPKPIAKGIIQILRALMADKKGPWTVKPFWFTTCNCTKKAVRKGECKHGKWVKPGHWQVEHFDRLSKVEQQQVQPINSRLLPQEKSGFDDKLDFETSAQMNAEFEKRFSK